MSRAPTRLHWIAIALISLVAFPLHAFAGVVTGYLSGPGWNAFTNNGTTVDYRYGPSMILNQDNSIDMFACSPGGENGAWDYIRYRHSPDGGLTWPTESIVLQPTPNSQDYLSNCDPGVVSFGGYYYIGYTSTTNTTGTQNNVFVARSANIGGPYEKWNGSGWGGDPVAYGGTPQPFITCDDGSYGSPAACPLDTYGAGEPSLVVKGNTLYIYYTWWSRDPNTNKPVNQTRVRTASTTDANWPANTTYQGVAINRDVDQLFLSDPGFADDSTDHKYVPAFGKFIAVGSARRFGPFSYIKLYESTDGITYYPAELPRQFIDAFANNAGITGDAQGNFQVGANNRIAYAYGPFWNVGYWSTAMVPIELYNTPLPTTPIVRGVIEGDSQVTLYFRTSGVPGDHYNIWYGPVGSSTQSEVSDVTSSPYTITGLTDGVQYNFRVIGVNSAEFQSSTFPPSGVDATPLPLTESPRVSVTASSEFTSAGLGAANAIDGDLDTFWSSAPGSTETTNQWITVDTGTNRMVKRVTLTPRQPSEVAYPNTFSIQVSTDNSTWITADLDIHQYRLESPTQYVYDFNEPIYGRYVRVNATRIGRDDSNNFYMQLADVKIEEIPWGTLQSSTVSPIPNAPSMVPGNVLDDNPATFWSSVPHGNSATNPSGNGTEWLAINTGVVNSIGAVRVTPRTGGLGFPTAFKFQSSNDGGLTWTDVGSYSVETSLTGSPGFTGYPNPGSNTQTFAFLTPVAASLIRLYATTLGADDYGNYYLQIADMKPDMLPARTATVSSSLPGWDAYKAVDGQEGTYWSSAEHGTAAATEWISIDTNTMQSWTGIRLKPRLNYCFPVDFQLQSSTDGVNWTTIYGQNYVSYPNPGTDTATSTQVFHFTDPVWARYFRLYATQLSTDNFGQAYYLQLDEFIADP